METSSNTLQQYYAELTDLALLRLAGGLGDLTPEAQAVLTRELQERGLELPKPAGQDEPLPEYAVQWVTVDRFRDLSSAIVARGALEAAGISCFLRDENTVRLDWQISNFIGGMRLQVPEQDRDAALAVLDQSPWSEVQQEANTLVTGELCPFCASPEVHRMERGIGVRAAALWLFALPLPRGARYWKCDNCNRQFSESELDGSETP